MVPGGGRQGVAAQGAGQEQRMWPRRVWPLVRTSGPCRQRVDVQGKGDPPLVSKMLLRNAVATVVGAVITVIIASYLRR